MAFGLEGADVGDGFDAVHAGHLVVEKEVIELIVGIADLIEGFEAVRAIVNPTVEVELLDLLDHGPANELVVIGQKQMQRLARRQLPL